MFLSSLTLSHCSLTALLTWFLSTLLSQPFPAAFFYEWDTAGFFSCWNSPRPCADNSTTATKAMATSLLKRIKLLSLFYLKFLMFSPIWVLQCLISAGVFSLCVDVRLARFLRLPKKRSHYGPDTNLHRLLWWEKRLQAESDSPALNLSSFSHQLPMWPDFMGASISV